MFSQIALGAALTLSTIVLGSLSLYLLEGRAAQRPSLADGRAALAQDVRLGAVGKPVGADHDGAVHMVWSAAFMALGVFVDWGPAVYFALESFTTLGFGDILPPHQWRILAGMAAANGLLNFGSVTAVLMEGVRDLRLRQTRRHGRQGPVRDRSGRPGCPGRRAPLILAAPSR